MKAVFNWTTSLPKAPNASNATAPTQLGTVSRVQIVIEP